MSVVWGLLQVVVVLTGSAVVVGLLVLGTQVLWEWYSGATRLTQLNGDRRAAEQQIEEVARRTDQAIIAEMLRRQEERPKGP